MRKFFLIGIVAINIALNFSCKKAVEAAKEEVVVAVDNTPVKDATPYTETKPEVQTLVNETPSNVDELSAFANL